MKATAPHAWLFQTAPPPARNSVNGVRHETGAMPAGHVFIPIMMKHRRRLYTEFAALLERNGLAARIDDGLAA